MDKHDRYAGYRHDMECHSLTRLSKTAQKDLQVLAWNCALKICIIIDGYSEMDCKSVADWYDSILDEMLTATYATEVK